MLRLLLVLAMVAALSTVACGDSGATNGGHSGGPGGSAGGGTGGGAGGGDGGRGSGGIAAGGASPAGSGGSGGVVGAGGFLDASSAGGAIADGSATDVASDVVGGERDPSTDAGTRSFVYVSGYAAPITVLSLNTATGALTPASMADTGMGGEPTSLAFSPDKRVVYAGDEQKDLPASRVIAFAINAATGALSEINRQDTGGTTLAHVGVHPSGKWVLAANYGTGNVTVFPVRPDGGLGAAMPRVPAGGQSHFIVFDRAGGFLFVPCIVSRYVAQFRFADGVLTPNSPPSVPINGGPRHMALSPDERFAYVLTQSESTIDSFTLDKTTGLLTHLETVNSTPSPTLGAHIAVHPSGKFLYASNRADSSISMFSIDQTTGRLTRLGYQRDMINYPWWFAMDPAGQLMMVASDRSATVLAHRLDPATGLLQRLGMPVAVPMRPTFVGILSLP